MFGMVCVLFSVAVWLILATMKGLPVSTTHSCIGGIIGMTVVSVGTSLPEIIVSVSASLHGQVDLAIGTAIGSNIVNILLILGLAALLHPFRVHSDVLRRELPLMLVVSLLAGYVLYDGVLSVGDGIFLLALAVIWLLYSVKIARLAEKQGNDSLTREHLAELPREGTLPVALLWLGVALIIGISRGITVLMNDGAITDTVLHWGEQALSGAGAISFTLLVFALYLPLTILIPSSSGLATLSIPIVAPLGKFAGVGGDLVVTAFQSASGLVNIITPTAAVVMGALALGHVPYDRWVKYVWKLILWFLLLALAFLVAGVLLG